MKFFNLEMFKKYNKLGCNIFIAAENKYEIFHYKGQVNDQNNSLSPCVSEETEFKPVLLF